VMTGGGLTAPGLDLDTHGMGGKAEVFVPMNVQGNGRPWQSLNRLN